MTLFTSFIQCLLFTVALLGISVFLTFAFIFLGAVIIAIIDSIVKLFKKENK